MECYYNSTSYSLVTLGDEYYTHLNILFFAERHNLYRGMQDVIMIIA